MRELVVAMVCLGAPSALLACGTTSDVATPADPATVVGDDDDSDGDGVADEDDRCPSRPGTRRLLGCPADDVAEVDDDDDDDDDDGDDVVAEAHEPRRDDDDDDDEPARAPSLAWPSSGPKPKPAAARSFCGEVLQIRDALLADPASLAAGPADDNGVAPANRQLGGWNGGRCELVMKQTAGRYRCVWPSDDPDWAAAVFTTLRTTTTSCLAESGGYEDGAKAPLPWPNVRWRSRGSARAHHVMVLGVPEDGHGKLAAVWQMELGPGID
ncbi:MAG: hypothetical protein KC635_22765 [Myxococcales bacterium]|nr:hypothetical protein [Myxococcales bacterium]